MYTVHEVALKLGELFLNAGYELALVGGSVRDIFLKKPSNDLDFTTNATPEQIWDILKDYLDDIWDIGKEFGTIGGNKYVQDEQGERVPLQVEITTYRTDQYASDSRKPEVQYGQTLEEDLARRDFTINAIALRLPSLELVDPHMGVSDLTAKSIRTPIEPEVSFGDDPLRMMRAVRFSASLGDGDFVIHPDTAVALLEMHTRLEIISVERIRDEFVKMLLSDHPVKGLEELIGYGLNDYILPEFEELKMQIDPEHHHKDVYAHSLQVLENAISYEQEYLGEKDLVVRLAALLHDIGKPKTRRFAPNGTVTFRHHDVEGAKMTVRILKRLKFDKKTINSVAKLVELHMRFYGYGDAKWTDSAVRRYAVDAGDELKRLHILTRSDVTTKNPKKSRRLASAYDDIEQRIALIAEKEELGKIRPDLNGNQIMEILHLRPNHNRKHRPIMNRAYNYMLEYRLTNGSITYDEAVSVLRVWAKDNIGDDNGK